MRNLTKKKIIAGVLLLGIFVGGLCVLGSLYYFGGNEKDGKTDGKTDENSVDINPGQGMGRFLLTDFPLGDADVKCVFITIESIEVHSPGKGWFTVVDYGVAGRTIDILQLQDGATADFGAFNLEAGKYTQIRLHLNEHNQIVIEKDGEYETHSLNIPSDQQVGIKVVQSFSIVKNGLTSLLLDFDAEKSIIYDEGQGYILNPTIKVIDIATTEGLSNVIEVDGGSIGINGEILVDIPSGALSGNTELTLLPMGESSHSSLSTTTILGTTYNLGPDGLNFDENISISIHYSDSEVIDNEIDEVELDIYYYDTELNDWVPTYGEVDTENNMVTTIIDHFTEFGVGGPPRFAPRINPARIEYSTDGANTCEVPWRVIAQITDRDGIDEAIFGYRRQGLIGFYVMNMTNIVADWYEAIIPLSFLRDEIDPIGIEVLIRATDNTGRESYAPLFGPLTPHLYTYNPDLDNDEMNDRWEIEYGLNFLVNDTSGDPDNDGLTNLEEYQNDYDPFVPNLKVFPDEVNFSCSYLYPYIDVNLTVNPPEWANQFKIDYTVSLVRAYMLFTFSLPPIFIGFSLGANSFSDSTGYIDYTGFTSLNIFDDSAHTNDFNGVYSGMSGCICLGTNAISLVRVDITLTVISNDGDVYSPTYNYAF